MVCVMHATTRVPGMSPSEVAWEMNTLMPDDAKGFDDPLLTENLYPPERFDHPNLRRLPRDFDRRRADDVLSGLIAKGCAGLRHDLRSAPEPVRAAFEAGAFPHREGACLRWLLPGLRADQFRSLASASGIALRDLVRGLWSLWGHGRVPHAPWLNQWARNPEKPIPDGSYAGGIRSYYVQLWKRVRREGGEIIRVASEDDVPAAVADAERRGVEIVLVDESLLRAELATG